MFGAYCVVARDSAEDGRGPGGPAGAPPRGGAAADPRAPLAPAHVGDGPPLRDPEPTALPQARAEGLGELVHDTVLDGARYGTCTLRAASSRGDAARHRGEPRRDALLTARFGTGDDTLLLLAVATGTSVGEASHQAAGDACRWIGEAVGRSHARLARDIRAGRRDDLRSGLHRLTDRACGKLRARAGDLGAEPDAYTADLRCLLLTADPDCRTRVLFGVGAGGLFRLRNGAWQDLEPPRPAAAASGESVDGCGSPPPAPGDDGAGPAGDRLTLRLSVARHPGAPPAEEPAPAAGPGERHPAPSAPPPVPFRFRASVARPGDTLLLATSGLAEPLRREPAFAAELAARWGPRERPPGLAAFLADTRLGAEGYADDRTAVAVWEA
ncbi:protein phosphatase 2C domain-containing protein [Streptomyces sp. DH12]|uniref:protein phosphatase 2C domain-containing protein n=1 Tax=Streptomyces sp. DH12 TaxID=2857010 RepID=UPI0027DF7405|nr:protein phosphatase 2C domain-containing protein [Streptomyces sp. DH12]